MFGLGPTEIIIIAVILLLLFGAKRLPEIGKGLGGAIRELKNVKKELRPKEGPEDRPHGDRPTKKEDDQPTLEARALDKALEQVPGVKKALEVKKKVEKTKGLFK